MLIKHHDTNEVIGFNHGCPCGCGMWSFIRLNNKDVPTFQKWDLVSGDDLHMTLKPSIGIKPLVDGKYHWHGFLENGVFVER